MAWLPGRGVASVNYPTGMNLGGDPSQALIHATTTGSFVVTLSSVDLGQGIKTVGAQIAAETLGVPYDSVMIDTADTDTGPHCMGTFASRGTHRIGNAIIMAAREAREVMLEVAATELEVDAGDLVTDGKGRIHVDGAPDRADRGAGRGAGGALQARAHHLRARHVHEAEERGGAGDRRDGTRTAARRTPAPSPRWWWTTRPARSRCSGSPTPTRSRRAVNPALAHQQIVGGAWMGISHALYETTEPYYPDRKCGPTDFSAVPDAGAGRPRGDGERDHRAGRRRAGLTAPRASAR